MKRAPTPADAVLGLAPRVVHEPATLDEACAVLAELARDGLASAFVGGGTQLGLGAAPTRLDAVVRTGGLARIVEYSPSDQVVTVEAGVTLGALQSTLAGERQRLSLDPPHPARSTIGGIVAANAFGPRRARSGAVRDLILGASLVRADGVLARGGGKVVKNVAGFDLPKLVCGSLGTLGLVAAVTLRVHPMPESTAVRRVRGLRAPDVAKLIHALRAAQLEPAALLARRSHGAQDDGWEVALAFEGFEAGVAQQVARLSAIAGAISTSSSRSIAAVETVDAGGDDPFAAHRAAREGARLRLKLAALSTALPDVAAALAPLAALHPGELAWYPTLGLGFFSSASDHPSEAAATIAALESARRALATLRGSLTFEIAPESLRGALEPWTAPSSIALHRAVKSRFDPTGLLAPGRFVGGI